MQCCQSGLCLTIFISACDWSLFFQLICLPMKGRTVFIRSYYVYSNMNICWEAVMQCQLWQGDKDPICFHLTLFNIYHIKNKKKAFWTFWFGGHICLSCLMKHCYIFNFCRQCYVWLWLCPCTRFLIVLLVECNLPTYRLPTSTGWFNFETSLSSLHCSHLFCRWLSVSWLRQIFILW